MVRDCALILIAITMVFSYRRYGGAAEIHSAADAGDRSKLAQLLKKDPSLLNARDQWGMTPLTHAALYHRIEAVRLLLDAGADPAAKDNKSGRSALDVVKAKLAQYDKVFTPQYTRTHEEFLRGQGLGRRRSGPRSPGSNPPTLPRPRLSGSRL